MTLLTACSGLPTLEGRSVSSALQDTNDTALGQAIQPRVQAHAGFSGIHLLADSTDAFAARMLLAHRAERSLDVQYYIWHADLTGTLLFEALHRAAERGVRVRLLLDDNNTSGLDATLAALDSHPNIEVRLFNPFAVRSPRAIGYLTDFFRLNRRMHNKSFTADNQATIVGGRNIGDEYFGAGSGTLFADLDVLAIGPVVGAVSSDFDRYWASGSTYPAQQLLTAAEPGALAELTRRAARVEADAEAAAYVEAVRTSPFVERLLQRELELLWAPTRMLSDDPAKGLGNAPPEQLLAAKLEPAIGPIERSLQIVSPYFVPANTGSADLLRLAADGVQIAVLTNSLEATDVAAVHAGYAKRRKTLLEAGIALFELRRAAQGPQAAPSTAAKLGVGSGGGSGGGSLKRAGSSASSLHAKTFSVDRAARVHRLVQFRPALGEAEHRDGLRDRQPGHRAADCADLRRRPAGHRLPRAPDRARRARVDRAAWRRDGGARQRAGHDLRPAAPDPRAVAAADRVAALSAAAGRRGGCRDAM